jgi:hypothetical protein
MLPNGVLTMWKGGELNISAIIETHMDTSDEMYC